MVCERYIGEGEEANAFLRRAMTCFDHAGDFFLKEMVEVHLEMEMMRHRVLKYEGSLSPLDEVDAAHAVLRGIKALILSKVYSLRLLIAQCYSENHIFHFEVFNELKSNKNMLN